ncbi:MAG: nicotinate (nicotinamide) nucleotide adenylyltransferase [Terracidiphilus sp.]|nr:nicotinate (nicotinamide) nucleotide adenylyltransferase [Terracidiphilus sp.]MDR3775484.1 nicotinate (nicotinamide) nucleotide adenylyltransferase [Terracidiphilus sp.]
MEQQPSRGRRIAFFGGSFDPPHLGHLAVARAAQAALGLDTVLFAPVGAQPLKPLGSTASYEDRLALTRLAIANDAGFAVSLADAPKDGGAPNYTLNTLEHLREDLPRGSALFCLMGADSFFGLRRWHRAAEIPFVAPLIVASRPGQLLDGLKAALPEGLSLESGAGEDQTIAGVEMRTCMLRNLAGQTTPFYLLPGLNVEISASDIRAGIRAAMDGQGGCQDLLPDAVFEAIRSRGLYR